MMVKYIAYTHQSSEPNCGYFTEIIFTGIPPESPPPQFMIANPEKMLMIFIKNNTTERY
jgi:hypothetical protein